MAADVKIVDLHTVYINNQLHEKSCYFTTWYIDYTVTAVTIDHDNTSQEEKGSAPHLTSFIEKQFSLRPKIFDSHSCVTNLTSPEKNNESLHIQLPRGTIKWL